MRTLKLILVLFFATSAAALSADDIKKDLQKVGQDFKQLGHDIKQTAKTVGKEVKKAGQEIHQETKEVHQDVKETGQDWGQRFKSAFAELGSGIKNAWSKLTNKPQEKRTDDFN